MEWLWILLAIVVIVVATWWRTRESMTNEEVQSAMQEFGVQPPEPKKPDISKFPIYGPKVDKSDVKAAEQQKKKKTAVDENKDYPAIYGPDLVMAPGTNPSGDTVSDNSYFSINPDLQKAFPTDGAPKPYLTDFSKFH